MNRIHRLAGLCLLAASQSLAQGVPPPPGFPQPPQMPQPPQPPQMPQPPRPQMPQMPQPPQMPRPGMPGAAYPGVPGAPTGAIMEQRKISEWPLPGGVGAASASAGPDGNIYVAIAGANRVARFDTRARTFKEWPVPPAARPQGVAVDRQGMVWYAGSGNGTIGQLNPATGQAREFLASPGSDPTYLAVDPRGGTVWFTMRNANRIGRLDAAGVIREYPAAGNPLGIAVDRLGRVWFAQSSGDKLGRFDPVSEQITEFPLSPGSRPQRIAAGADGMTLWVSLGGTGRLAEVDAGGGQVLREVALPAGAAGSPFAVAVDGRGSVWVSEANSPGLARVDALGGIVRSVRFGTTNLGIRDLVADQDGRVWFLGATYGRLGLVE